MFSAVKMMDMAKTPEEVSEETREYSSPMPIESVVNRYPYGLCISLDEDSLKKLNLTESPDVGDMIHLFAMARVTSMSQNEKSDGTVCQRVELQITHLGLEDEDDEAAEAA